MPIYELEIQGRQFEVEAPNTEALKAAVPRIMSAAGLGTGAPAASGGGTIDIRAPNGDTVQFPAGTPDSTILDVMRREYGGPTAAPAADQASAAPETWGQYLTGLGREAVQGATMDFGDDLGLTDLDASKRFGEQHPIASTVAKIVGSVAPFVAGPGAALARAAVAAPRMRGLTGNVARSAALGAGVGAVSGAGAAEGGLADRAAGAATGAAVGGVAGAVAPPVAAAAGRAVNRVMPGRQVQGPPAPPTAGQEAVLAGERIGVPLPRAIASDNQTVQMLGGATQRVPFIGSPPEAAAERTTTALGEAAERTAAGYGAAAGPLHAGDAAKQGLLDWMRGGSAAVDRRLYGAVDRLINPNVTVPLSETRVAVLTLEHEMQQSTGRAAQGVVDLLSEAVARPQGLSWRGAQQLRTEIGARLSRDIVPEAGTSMPALRQVYDALRVDMGRIATTAGGPRAEAAWRHADAVHRLIAQRREDLARIVGAQGEVAPEGVFERLVAMARAGGRGDIQRLTQARQAMGADAWNEVASSAVRQLGRTATDDFSPARFVTAYGKLSENGRNLLFSSTPAGQQGVRGGLNLRQALDDIATVSQRFQETAARYANPSGTGRTMTAVGSIATAVTAPLTALKAAVGGYTLSLWLSRPVTANAVRGYMQAQLQGRDAAGAGNDDPGAADDAEVVRGGGQRRNAGRAANCRTRIAIS